MDTIDPNSQPDATASKPLEAGHPEPPRVRTRQRPVPPRTTSAEIRTSDVSGSSVPAEATSQTKPTVKGAEAKTDAPTGQVTIAAGAERFVRIRQRPQPILKQGDIGSEPNEAAVTPTSSGALDPSSKFPEATSPHGEVTDTARRDNQTYSEDNLLTEVGEEGYAVGYKKPPLHTRFKPGVPAYRPGRPKREQTLDGALRKELARTRKIKHEGRWVTRTQAEIIVIQLITAAMQGKPQAIAALSKYLPPVKMGSEISISGPATGPTGPKEIEESDRAMLNWFKNHRQPDEGDPQ